MPDRPPPVVENPLLFLDYDGTLAPLRADPMSAYPLPGARDLLVALSERHPLWIVTGRHLRDLAVLLDLPLRAIGLHGAQEGIIGGDIRSALPDGIEAAVKALHDALPSIEGAWVEDKEYTFALHYGSVGEARIRSGLAAWLAGIPDAVEVLWGKDVLELRAKGISKGVAVKRIAGEYAERVPIYLGDDVTDEDAFRVLGRHAVTVKVGVGHTVARYRVADEAAVVAYLKRFLD